MQGRNYLAGRRVQPASQVFLTFPIPRDRGGDAPICRSENDPELSASRAARLHRNSATLGGLSQTFFYLGETKRQTSFIAESNNGSRTRLRLGSSNVG